MKKFSIERLLFLFVIVAILVADLKGESQAGQGKDEAADDAYKSGYAAAQEKCEQEIYRLQDENESLREQYEEIQYELADSDLQAAYDSGYEKGYAVGIIDGRAEARKEISGESE